MTTSDRLLGGLYGLLVGDACGVPYEFKRPNQLPKFDEIDMIPPAGFKRTWSEIHLGTYSDDGAQALCLLETLAEQPAGPLNTLMLQGRLVNWMNQGYMSVDGYTFDVGNQTGASLRRRAAGLDIDGLNKADFCGNGSLMRTLPLALWHTADTPVAQLLADAAAHSTITHPYIRNVICVQLYTMVAVAMLAGTQINPAIAIGVEQLITEYEGTPHADEMKIVLDGERTEQQGSGYVVDSLWSSFYAVLRSDTYEQAVKNAIAYGNDTDTTACIAGGLAGIQFGLDGIPARWVNQLRGKDQWLNPLAAKLLLHHSS
jgi:ADP-ribosylglycohydrolase